MRSKVNRKSKKASAVATSSKAILAFLRDLFADDLQALAGHKKLA